MKNLYFIIILLIFASCETNFNTSELTQNFTSEEIKDLKKFVDFFKVEFCENSSYDFNNCFEKFAPNWIEKGLAYSSDKIDFTKQKEFYSTIDKKTFDEIWDLCMTHQIQPIEREYLDVCANTEGKYVKFLKDFGKTSPLVQKYYEDIIAAGDFDQTGFSISDLWNKRNEIDLNNPNFQILIAIHILTMNDQFLRNKNESEE